MKADSRTEGEVRITIKRFTDAYAERDLEVFLGCFAPDADVVLYGTGADEKCVGMEAVRVQVERDWSQSECAAMLFTWISVSSAGSVAWAAVDGTFAFRVDGEDITLPARGSLVLERRDGQWLILHAHFSTPVSSQEEGRSF